MIYSKTNLPKRKDEDYTLNHDQYRSIGTHWIALYVSSNNVTYFYSFGVEYIPKEIKKFMGNKNITTNISYLIKPRTS